MINVLKINCGLQFYGLRIYAIMLPSSGFSVAHYLFVRYGVLPYVLASFK